MMDKYEECRREMMVELGEAACDEALRLGWPVDGGSGDPVDWMVSEIERLRDGEDKLPEWQGRAEHFFKQSEFQRAEIEVLRDQLAKASRFRKDCHKDQWWKKAQEDKLRAGFGGRTDFERDMI